MPLSDKLKETAAKAKEGAAAEKARLTKKAKEAETFAAEHSAAARERIAKARPHVKDTTTK